MEKAKLFSEDELVVFLKKNSPVAFQQLFDLYSQRLYHFALSYLKSDADAEEVVQEVFLKIWENRANLKSDTSLKSYLFTIAFNAIIKSFNKKMKEDKYKHELFEWLSQHQQSLESHLDFEALLDKLDSLIEQLPKKRKVVFLKRKKEGKSIAEIAEELDISPKTVKNQITEAMKFLKKSFLKEDIDAILLYFLFLS
ncbi:MAG TPA: RNA polymerase sigma-70 factor [Sunxiuqinia sp.]|nr:RNA polymerase sigma-70 factor [Sunxiuqinia sp.]